MSEHPNALEPQIVIVGPKEDPHVREVCRCLQHKPNLQVAILNTEHFPYEPACKIELGTGKPRVYLDDNGQQYVLLPEKVRSIWWWRPKYPALPQNIVDKGQRSFVLQHYCQMLESLWYLFDGLWVNHPLQQEMSLNRAYQLYAAKRMGFHIPETIITSEPAAILDFWQKHKNKVIYKTMVPDASKFPSTLDEKQMQSLPQTSHAPLIFQEYLDIASILEIYVIEEQAFATQVFTTTEDKPTPNRFTLTTDVERRITRLLRLLNLSYAKATIAIDGKGRHVFLKLDPTGNFFAAQEKLQAPLSDTMARLLIKGKNMDIR